MYIPNVVDSKDVHFFKFPRLGAFYGLAFKIKSYLSEKIFDSNRTKIETFEKAEQEFETEQQE